MALYHPTLGYYTSRRDVIGRSADYLTSSELTPLFGAMLGRQLREMWERLDRPDRFDAVEAGPGTGVLARDVLGWAARTAPDLAAALRYTLVETSPTLAERQQTTLAAEGFEAQWRDDLPSTVSGCIFSNELLDAMPVHRVAVEDGALREVYAARPAPGRRRLLRGARPPAGRRLPRRGQPRSASLDRVRRRRPRSRLRPHVRLRIRGRRPLRRLARRGHTSLLLPPQPGDRSLRPHRPSGHHLARRFHDDSPQRRGHARPDDAGGVPGRARYRRGASAPGG